MRYLLNEESGIIHDSQSNCDDAENRSLTPLTYKGFVAAIREGADPCDHCFRSDEIEADIEALGDAAEEATDIGG